MVAHTRILACACLILLSTTGARADETEADDGFMDEFALLEDALAADEVESASKNRQSIFWSPVVAGAPG